MKIGILTHHHPENRNYGAMLQLFALYSTIKIMGHTPVVVNYEFIRPVKRSIKSNIRHLLSRLIAIKPFIVFTKKYLPNKSKFVNETNISDLNDYLDAFIVGSDQVWRYNFVPNIRTFFLDFVDDHLPKIAYAASFGIDKWNEAPQDITDQISVLLQRFNNISVRERSGIKICEYFSIKAELALDPVFLISDQEYQSYFPTLKFNKNKNRYLAIMILDSTSETSQLIISLSKSTGIPFVDLNGRTFPFISKISSYKYSVEKWIRLIKNSDLIVTDSFHCLAFSIIFKRQFICIPNKSRGMARIEDLLGSMNLSDRILYNLDFNSLKKLAERKIDFQCCDQYLKDMKESSLSFLSKSINQND